MGRLIPSRRKADHSHLTQTLQHARHSCELVATSSYRAYDAAKGPSLLRRRGQAKVDVAEGSFRTDAKTAKAKERFNHDRGRRLSVCRSATTFFMMAPAKLLGVPAPFTQASYVCGRKVCRQYIRRI